MMSRNELLVIISIFVVGFLISLLLSGNANQEPEEQVTEVEQDNSETGIFKDAILSGNKSKCLELETDLKERCLGALS